MNLEEIINAAVEKKFRDMLEQEFGQNDYQEVRGRLRDKFNSVMEEEYAKRQDEIREKVRALVERATINISFKGYANFDTDPRQ